MELSNNYPEFSIDTPSETKSACSTEQIPLLTTQSLGNHDETSLLGQRFIFKVSHYSQALNHTGKGEAFPGCYNKESFMFG